MVERLILGDQFQITPLKTAPQPLTTPGNLQLPEKVNKVPVLADHRHPLDRQSRAAITMETKTTPKMASSAPEKDKSKVHKLSLKGSAKLVAEFVSRNPRI